MNHLNVVELMMGMQKMRARKIPGNQAHITNLKDDPVQIAADAAEGELRGFSEEENTMGVASYAPLSAMALLIGSQCGRKGVLTQCLSLIHILSKIIQKYKLKKYQFIFFIRKHDTALHLPK